MKRHFCEPSLVKGPEMSRIVKCSNFNFSWAASRVQGFCSAPETQQKTSINSSSGKLIYSDFEIFVWWHPNWLPNFFLSRCDRIHKKVHTKEHFSEGSQKDSKNIFRCNARAQASSLLKFTDFFTDLNITIHNCQVKWKSIKKTSLRTLKPRFLWSSIAFFFLFAALFISVEKQFNKLIEFE